MACVDAQMSLWRGVVRDELLCRIMFHGCASWAVLFGRVCLVRDCFDCVRELHWHMDACG